MTWTIVIFLVAVGLGLGLLFPALWIPLVIVGVIALVGALVRGRKVTEQGGGESGLTPPGRPS